ncbi:SgcJ/EcaC family oxidoreductase [uncultured Sphingomonas sp.]|uniref:YybH family protein n=1 Tax=uncultured Sphingomonas sp. TaxID=158754 RepID=UPI00260E7C20|nr:SgcJ/EcaC family oxidoreductase [uncultured Sphingomonas sp.]
MMALPQAPAITAPAQAPATAELAPIVLAMADSAAGWNAGDLDRFMAVYADDAVYVTGRGLVRGKAAIADTYRRSFARGGNMRGRLSFGDMAFRRLDPTHQILWARWTLTPAAAGAKVETGMTSLVFERRREGWRIVSDHSS